MIWIKARTAVWPACLSAGIIRLMGRDNIQASFAGRNPMPENRFVFPLSHLQRSISRVRMGPGNKRLAGVIGVPL